MRLALGNRGVTGDPVPTCPRTRIGCQRRRTLLAMRAQNVAPLPAHAKATRNAWALRSGGLSESPPEQSTAGLCMPGLLGQRELGQPFEAVYRPVSREPHASARPI